MMITPNGLKLLFLQYFISIKWIILSYSIQGFVMMYDIKKVVKINIKEKKSFMNTLYNFMRLTLTLIELITGYDFVKIEDYAKENPSVIKINFLTIFYLCIFFYFRNSMYLYAKLWSTILYFICLDKNTLLFSVFLLALNFFFLIFIKFSKVFEIKRVSVIFCMNILKLIFFNLFNFSKLFLSYSLIFNLTLFGQVLTIEYNLGIDNTGLIFVGLTIFLIPICLVISWKSINYNTKYFFLIFLILEILLINVFFAIDLVLFYIAFESILIPMYFLIGSWGSRERKMHAAYQFFLFTLGGSLLMLTSLIFCQSSLGSTNLTLLLNFLFSPYKELFLWSCFFIGFAVKIPMMPVHIWLPEAHVESPTGGSVALAGILLKLGTYGMLRFLLPLFQFSSVFFSPFVFLVSFLSVGYASFSTLRQIDLKKIIAYSSIIHMNYLMFGLFSFNLEGLVGSLILMVAHGFVSGGLFVCIGILYDRYHTRLQKPYGGLNYYMPFFSFFFLVFTLANISFPGTINFLGEFFVLLGLFMDNFFLGITVMFLMILSTCYSLWLYNKVFSGLANSSFFLLKSQASEVILTKIKFNRLFLINFTDINLRETFSLIYLLIPVFFLGLRPKSFLSFSSTQLSSLLIQ